MKQNMINLLVMVALALAAISPVEAKPDAKWNTECIGNYQMTVPGGVEVATARFRISAEASFSDRKLAPFSKLNKLEE